MFRNIDYIDYTCSLDDVKHNYHINDDNPLIRDLGIPVSVTSKLEQFIPSPLTRVAAIIIGYSGQKLPVAPNLALWLTLNYSKPAIKHSQILANMTDYLPQVDYKKYYNCTLRHLNDILEKRRFRR
jgi:hypothetical protein